MIATPKYKDAPHYKAYWHHGNGKELLNWAGIKIDFQNFSKYAHLYHQVDDLADQAVRDTYLSLPYHEASTLILRFAQSPISENDTVPESLKKLFLQMQKTPEWLNMDLVNIGASTCMRSGTNALIILRDFTLMGGYDYAYLNKPLIFTGALKKGAVKRLKDTLEFWVRVTRENALHVNSEAYQLIVRTRLMHSYARLSIKKKIENWEFDKWGEPVNHWDMIATYTGFSLVFMQGLKKLGMNISEKEEQGMFHLWKYVGYLLGIPDAFLPENKMQATEQLYLWSSIQPAGDEDSKHLAQALLSENLENTIFKFTFQRKLLLRLHKSMNWFLLDAEINERLGIPKVAFYPAFPQLIRRKNIQERRIKDPKKLEKLKDRGHKEQMKVLDDYIKHTPKDFHY